MAKKGTTRKAKKGKKRDDKIYTKELKGIDLRDYIGKKFERTLSKEFEIVHVIPTGMVICTCGPLEENIKMFFLSYPEWNDYKDDKLTISCDEKITDEELRKLKKAFKQGKYKR